MLDSHVSYHVPLIAQHNQLISVQVMALIVVSSSTRDTFHCSQWYKGLSSTVSAVDCANAKSCPASTSGEGMKGLGGSRISIRLATAQLIQAQLVLQLRRPCFGRGSKRTSMIIRLRGATGVFKYRELENSRLVQRSIGCILTGTE